MRSAYYTQTHRRAIAESEIVSEVCFLPFIYMSSLLLDCISWDGAHRTHSLCDDLFGFYGIVTALIIRLEQHKKLVCGKVKE